MWLVISFPFHYFTFSRLIERNTKQDQEQNIFWILSLFIFDVFFISIILKSLYTEITRVNASKVRPSNRKKDPDGYFVVGKADGISWKFNGTPKLVRKKIIGIPAWQILVLTCINKENADRNLFWFSCLEKT